MKIDPGLLRRLACAGGIVGVLALVLARGAGPPGRAGFVPAPIAPELRDLAVGCLASGEVRPAVAQLSDADLEAIIAIVARTIGAYQHVDFASFLALRAGDVETVAVRRSQDLEALRAFGRELRIPEEELDTDFLGVLERFWEAYYDGTPVARFVPEGTRVELHEEGLGARSLEDWSESFVALRDRVPGPWIQHELVVPHQRDIERIVSDGDPLRWLDLDLGFETREGSGARLVARFVWDGELREWYLQDAASVYSVGDRSERHLIL